MLSFNSVVQCDVDIGGDDQDMGYCLINVSLGGYALLYAPMLYMVSQARANITQPMLTYSVQTFTTDSGELRQQEIEHQLRATAFAPLIEDDAAPNTFESILSLVADPSIRMVAASEITIQKRVGCGGFGEVFSGMWLGTPVAVKRILISSYKANQSGALASLLKEVLSLPIPHHLSAAPHCLSSFAALLCLTTLFQCLTTHQQLLAGCLPASAAPPASPV